MSDTDATMDKLVETCKELGRQELALEIVRYLYSRSELTISSEELRDFINEKTK